jgi:hypothetical protein
MAPGTFHHHPRSVLPTSHQLVKRPRRVFVTQSLYRSASRRSRRMRSRRDPDCLVTLRRVTRTECPNYEAAFRQEAHACGIGTSGRPVAPPAAAGGSRSCAVPSCHAGGLRGTTTRPFRSLDIQLVPKTFNFCSELPK